MSLWWIPVILLVGGFIGVVVTKEVLANALLEMYDKGVITYNGNKDKLKRS